MKKITKEEANEMIKEIEENRPSSFLEQVLNDPDYRKMVDRERYGTWQGPTFTELEQDELEKSSSVPRGTVLRSFSRREKSPLEKIIDELDREIFLTIMGPAPQQYLIGIDPAGPTDTDKEE